MSYNQKAPALSAKEIAELRKNHHVDQEEVREFGFWIYLMSDCITFAALFAVYVILNDGINGGPTGKEIFDLKLVIAETFILLTSSLTCGLASIAFKGKNLKSVISWLVATFVLGAAFLGLELTEFANLIADGYGPTHSGFLSAFFALLGTHGFHILIGLVWIVLLIIQLRKRGFNEVTSRKMATWGLFWHFLDIIWVFIFTVVYLIGVS